MVFWKFASKPTPTGIYAFIWMINAFLWRFFLKKKTKTKKTISIPRWYRYGLSKNEQSKFEIEPLKVGGIKNGHNANIF